METTEGKQTETVKGSKWQTDGGSKGQLKAVCGDSKMQPRANRWRQQRAAKGKQMESAQGSKWQTNEGSKEQQMETAKGKQIEAAKGVSGGSTAQHLASMMVCLTTRAVKATEVSMSSSLRVLLLMRCLWGSAWAVYQHVQNSCQHFIAQKSLLSRNCCKNIASSGEWMLKERSCR